MHSLLFSPQFIEEKDITLQPTNCILIGNNSFLKDPLSELLKPPFYQLLTMDAHHPGAFSDLSQYAKQADAILLSFDTNSPVFFEYIEYLKKEDPGQIDRTVIFVEDGMGELVQDLIGDNKFAFLEYAELNDNLPPILEKFAKQKASKQPSKPPPSSPPAEQGWVGRTIGSAVIEKKIGSGSMGEIYLAYQNSLKRWVAIKVIKNNNRTGLDLREQLQSEALMLARLRNPHVVQIYDAGFTQENLFYVTMEYIPGHNLKQFIKSRGPLSERQAIEFLRQATAGLHAVHSCGLVHRDIKASNFLINENGLIILTDFGIAINTQENKKDEGNIVLGTPEYISPEQAFNELVDHRSDIYSLGIVFFFLLTGKVPFKGSEGAALILKRMREPFPDPRRFRPDLSQGCKEILLRMVAKRRESRYQNCDELLRALIDLLGRQHAPSKQTPSNPPQGARAEVSAQQRNAQLSQSQSGSASNSQLKTFRMENAQSKPTEKQTKAARLQEFARELKRRAEEKEKEKEKEEADAIDEMEAKYKEQFFKAQGLYIQRQYKQALEAFQLCLEYKPDDPKTLSNISKLEERLGGK